VLETEPWKLLIALGANLGKHFFSAFTLLIERLIYLNPKLLIQWLDNTSPQLGLTQMLVFESIYIARQKG
jgi:hypothetical protein